MRNIRGTYKKPKVPWNSTQIKEDKVIMKSYGLRRKRELWKTQEQLRRYRERARNLIAANDKAKEKRLIDKMVKLGLLEPNSSLDNILALSITNLLERRLQSVIVKKKITDNVNTARQFIVHGHIVIGNRKIKFPSYIVPSEEEREIKINPLSKITVKDVKPKSEAKAEKPVEEKPKEEENATAEAS